MSGNDAVERRVDLFERYERLELLYGCFVGLDDGLIRIVGTDGRVDVLLGYGIGFQKSLIPVFGDGGEREVYPERKMHELAGEAQSIRTLRTLRKGTRISSPENFDLVCGPCAMKENRELKAECNSRENGPEKAVFSDISLPNR